VVTVESIINQDFEEPPSDVDFTEEDDLTATLNSMKLDK
jgi:hypothetical protein